jgi:hypothetical protein
MKKVVCHLGLIAFGGVPEESVAEGLLELVASGHGGDIKHKRGALSSWEAPIYLMISVSSALFFHWAGCIFPHLGISPRICMKIRRLTTPFRDGGKRNTKQHLVTFFKKIQFFSILISEFQNGQADGYRRR